MPVLNLPKKNYRKYAKKSRKSDNNNHRWVYNTSTWKELRLQFLSENPLCTECLKQGKYISAVEVHHIKPISQFKDKRTKQFWGFNKDNLRGLCTEHHKAEHQASRNEAREQELQRIKKLIEENRRSACI